MKLLNTLIAALALALPFSTPVAQPVKVEVPLGIQMGDKLEDVVKKNKLKPTTIPETYSLKGVKGVPKIFFHIALKSHPSTGVCMVLLATDVYREAQRGVFWADAKELKNWLTGKYGEGYLLSESEDGRNGEVNIGWTSWVFKEEGGAYKLKGDVSLIRLTVTPMTEDGYSMISLIYVFDNAEECDKAINDDKFKGL